MFKTELAELLRNGESSGLEFKRDDVHPKRLAKEIAALLNLEGGHILLGVEAGGIVSGLIREPTKAEEWVMGIGCQHIHPPVIPYWETLPWEGSKRVGIISLPADAPYKPYKAKQGRAWVTMMRVGTTSRPASREEEARLYQSSGLMRYDIKAAPGSSLQDLDLRRLENYFREIRQQSCPAEEEEDDWIRLLINTDLMLAERGKAIATTAAVLLFGIRPNRFLPQAGITAVAYPETEKDYAARERATLRGPIAPLFGANGQILDNGLIEQAMDFVRRNVAVDAWIDDGGQRQEKWDYPLEAVRETLVNAIAHRDYSITVTDIELSLYRDRLEVVSPGRLPNTVTVEKMMQGYRAARNELIKEVLRDYRYVEATGLGVPRKIIRGMREHNGTEPDLIEGEDQFTVRLWKQAAAGRPAVGADGTMPA
ncbi:MAG: ATP-dependent DNA helicase RecG [bacterium]|nr:ATP-dependent DNA helicase RecG [bacterium]